MRSPSSARRRAGAPASIAWGAALAAGVALATSVARYRQTIAREHERVARGGVLVTTSAGAIECADIGDGAAVLAIHGAGGGYDQALDALAPLAASHRLIAMSRFGYLGTPMPRDASPRAQADAHAALMDALGVGSASVVAESAGAPSAVQLALRHPQRVRALVLVVPALFAPRANGASAVRVPIDPRFALAVAALACDYSAWAAMRVAPDTMAAALFATARAVVTRASSAERARLHTMLRHLLPLCRRRAGIDNDTRIVLNLSREPLERIAVPTLVVGVRDDAYGLYDNARYTATHIPGARLMSFARGGHAWMGHHDALLREIAAFVAARA